MPHTLRIHAVPVRLVLTALSLLLLNGCSSYPTSSATQSPQYVLSNDGAKAINDQTINTFLDRSPTGGIMSSASSPWGPNVEIVADERYLAASGRECRRLQIVSSQAATRRALVCKTPNGWVEQRVVTQSVEGRFQ
ncbi:MULTISPECIES: DVU3141 family protein [unclassified Halomonas]|uniref:DVU3141 family protein n=1 Tax=unclassified Halomonas TaxID=2609666 RepID=UPI00207690AA|nr:MULTISPECIES: DVU3141 family protein [unclassified Halomonas]